MRTTRGEGTRRLTKRLEGDGSAVDGPVTGGPDSNGVSASRSLTLVLVGSMLANVCGYALHLVVSRQLHNAAYSEFAVLLQAQLVLSVPAVALQAVIARETVTRRLADDRRNLWRLIAAVTVIVAVIAVMAVPVLMRVSHVSLWVAAMGCVSAPLLVLLSSVQGVLQGRSQFMRLALLLGAAGLLRTVPPALSVFVGATAAGALGVAAVGCAVAAVLGLWMCRTPIRSVGCGDGPVRVATVVSASQVQLVLTVLTSVDLLMCRNVLTGYDAGVYALGAIAAKAAFWLPQSVGVVFFPQMAHPEIAGRAIRKVLVLLALCGAVVTVGAAVCAPIVPMLVGVSYRGAVGLLWMFALQGALLSVLQGALLYAVAQRWTAVAAVAWVAAICEVFIVALCVHTPRMLILTALAAIFCATAVTCVVVLRRAPTRL